MPMSFPTIGSIERYLCGPTEPADREAAARRGVKLFRFIEPSETAEHYRTAAADFARDVLGDAVLASEIRTGLGWDKQDKLTILSEIPGGLELIADLLDSSYRRKHGSVST